MATDLGAQLAIQQKLKDTLLAAKTKNPAFSIRAFAKKLSVSHSALSEILNGKRPVSRKMVERVVCRLDLSPKDSEALVRLFPTNRRGSGARSEPTVSYSPLSTDQFHGTKDWYYFAILSLCETSDFKADPKWIARRLGIRLEEAQIAMNRLLRLELIRKDAHGKFVRGAAAYTTSDDVGDSVLRSAHAQNFELARRSLDADSITERDFTSITMAIDPGKIGVAKKMIREFEDKISGYLECEPKKEVYRICVLLFPLTRKVKPHVH